MSLRPRKPFPIDTTFEQLQRFYLSIFKAPLETYLLPSLAWQCVTHKSYAHGFHPYNDKLAFFGRRTIKLAYIEHTLKTHGLESVENPVTAKTCSRAIQKFAYQHNVSSIMRWKPAFADDLCRSARDEIANECVEAIIGGITLSKGTEKSRSFCLEQVLS